jgi:putative transposase
MRFARATVFSSKSGFKTSPHFDLIFSYQIATLFNSVYIMYFNPEATVRKYRNALPHWNQDKNIYFVTFRLFDSLPISKLRTIQEEIAQWRKSNPDPLSPKQEEDYAKRFTRKIHRWLDAGCGACFLGRLTVRKEMESILNFFAGKRYRLGEYIIMPNHVHALITPTAEYEL